jgi:hypothetical protein
MEQAVDVFVVAVARFPRASPSLASRMDACALHFADVAMTGR